MKKNVLIINKKTKINIFFMNCGWVFENLNKLNIKRLILKVRNNYMCSGFGVSVRERSEKCFLKNFKLKRYFLYDSEDSTGAKPNIKIKMISKKENWFFIFVKPNKWERKVKCVFEIIILIE